MTDAPPSSSASLSTWVQTHKQAAAGGAAILGVAALAVYKRSHPSGAAGAAAAATDAATTGGDVAGLSGLPNTSATDIENAVQDQLNTAISNLQGQLNTPAAPAAPAAPPAAPKPGAIVYRIVKGDTPRKIAQKVYGRNDAYSAMLIRYANPVLISFSEDKALDYLAGDTIRIPAWHANPSQPAAPKPGTGPAVKPPPKPVKK